ncbi:hypothetical protein ACGFIW_01785 [Micromonospora sp. NPDC048935]|uniref:hypothetical protein n=1 Tax=Micromonospora sp. NPDC048935 TaxID=3364262 RepID=UPI003723E32E
MASHFSQAAKGQVWADTDTRGNGRHLKVLQVVPAKGEKAAYVIAVHCDRAGRVVGRPIRTKIQLAELLRAGSPFRLVDQ